QRLVIEVGCEELAVAGLEAAVSTDVQVPATIGRYDTDVLAACFGTLPSAAGDTELELVRRPEAAKTEFESDCHAHGVLHTEPAPGRADTTLDIAQRFSVGLSGFESSVDE